MTLCNKFSGVGVFLKDYGMHTLSDCYKLNRNISHIYNPSELTVSCYGGRQVYQH